ncbi:MAG: protein kinase [Isosphaeraceae bacterium]|nr:protein kinase [Isosphaeraceae bacterium]
MVTRPMPCDPGRLRLLLEDRLPEQEQDALSEHLEGCEPCRETLERMAAETRWWSDVKELASAEPVMDGRAVPLGPATEAGDEGHDAVTIPNGFLAPVDDPESLGKIGPYEVSKIIGRGGNGLVLKALDPALRRLVAIKVLAPELATSAAARRRFAREARAAAAVTHEHVVAIHAVDTAPNGFPYLVMTYVPGKSLQERLDRSGTLEVKEILRIGMQTASGLAAAHAQGLVHRDIKPANILLENGIERVKITDFGLARAADDASLSQSGVVAGTPQYMAPEQARGEMVDHRADLFSLGSVMYTMATGRPPFRADSTLAVLRRVSDDPPRPIREINPEIPEWLCDIIGRLHEKDPARRFQSATDVSEVLEQCLAFVQNPTDRVPPYRREPAAPSAPPLRRWALPIAALLVVGLGLGAAEAIGVTHFVSTVLRIKTPDGMLVINVEEPGVEVEVDGERVILTGLGEQAITLDPGPHRLLAKKDGVRIRDEPIEISRGKKRLVTIGIDPKDQMKSQAEYVASQSRKEDPSPVAVEPSGLLEPSEVTQLKNHIKELQAQNKRLANSNNGDQKVAPRTHVGSTDMAMPVASAVEITAPGFPAERGSSMIGMLMGSGGDPVPAAVAAQPAPVATLTSTVGKLGEPVVAIEYVADQHAVAVAAGRTVRVWNVGARSSIPQMLEGHKNTITCLALSPHEPLLVTGSLDRTVRKWDVSTGKSVGVLKAVDGVAQSVAFRPDGKALAIALEGGRVLIVDPATGTLIRELPKHEQPVLAVRYSPDGNILATAGGTEDLTRLGLVKLWDAETGQEKATLEGHRYMIKAMTFSPDGSTLALGDSPPGKTKGARIYLWNVASLKQLPHRYVRDGVRALAYSPDGGTLAATLQSGDLYVYRVVDNAMPTMSFSTAHGSAAPGLAFGPQGETLATGGEDGTVKLWTLSSVSISPPARQAIPLQDPLATFRDGMGERVWSAVFAPDGKTLAACYSVNVNEDSAIGDGGGGLALWDPIVGNLRTTIMAPHVIRGVAFAPDGQRLATAEFDQAVCLRSASDGRVLKTFPVSSKGTNAVSFSRDGHLLAAAGLDEVVYVWEVETGREVARLKEHIGPVHTVAFSPDGNLLASGGADGDVLLWNLTTGKIRLSLEGHEGAVEQLAFSPDGKTLATASWDQTVKLWRVLTGKEVRTLRGYSEPVLGLAFSADGNSLATCAGTWGAKGGDGVGELILWDLAKRRALTPALSHPKRLLGIAFSPNAKTFATASWDGAVRLWNVDSLSSHYSVSPIVPTTATPASRPASAFEKR